MLTRFVASAGSRRDPIADDPATVEDVRCLVRLRGRHGERELVIATELGGGIRVFGDRDRLPHRARAQLAFHEVASGRVLELDADELHVLDLQTLEMLPDAPGPNDALYLYGAMRGPYPAALGAPAAAVDGQLTVTRADLLGGLIDGVGQAFAYAPDAHGARCVHALLPGARASEIDRGHGIVLALPLVPGWLLDGAVPNDLVAAQILHDVLGALRVDLGTQADAAPLPVPSRAALERRLVAAGWRIEGDEAVRAKGRGILGSLLKGEDRWTLPRQGTLDELVAEARAVLARVPDVPTAEAAALRRRSARPASAPGPVAAAPMVAAAGIPRVVAAVPAVVATGIPRVVPAPAPPGASASAPGPSAPRPRVATERTEWMKDFVEAHRSPARPPPRLATPARAISPAAIPPWMADFDEPDPPSDPDPPAESAPPRDWSKDFD
jgi:hypothetical protein